MLHSFFRRTLLSLVASAVLLELTPAPASAQLQIKSDDATVKFGFLGQLWADWTQDATAASAGPQGYAQNYYLLRARLMFGGTIGNKINYFFQTDDPKLGLSPAGTAATKTLTTGNATSPGFIIQDAWVSYQVSDQLQLSGGEMFVPNSRLGLLIPWSFYTVNISSLATVSNAALTESSLRDIGFQARGYFFHDHLQYRGGIFAGERDADGRNAPRPALYLQYDFFEPEKEYTYYNTALGKKKILAIDVGGDKQGSYRSETANLSNDTPVLGGDEIGFEFSYFHWDGRNKFTTIPDQNDYLLEGDYYFHRAKLQPFAKFETQDFVAAVNGSKDIDRWGTGANYYIHGQNLKWTFQYTRALPRNGSAIRPSNEFTMQVQVFYY
ncbi:MAG: porin [Bryobacteraceae bacterium]